MYFLDNPVISQFGTASGLGAGWDTWTNSAISGVTVGNGTVVARRKQIGKTVFCFYSFTMGGTSAVGSDPILTLPATSVSYPNSGTPLMSTGYMNDVSAGFRV